MLLTWMAKPPSAGVAMPNISWASCSAAAGGAASKAPFANFARLRTLLFASAGLFLLLGIA
jgi:hypothetical protein